MRDGSTTLRWSSIIIFVANNILCHNTIQTITLLLHEREHLGTTAPTLLVCPTSVIGNWVRELQRFAPSLRIMAHRGPDRRQGEAFAGGGGRARRGADQLSLAGARPRDARRPAWGTVVLDEAQNIKNAATKQAQAARALKRRPTGWP